MLILGIETSCDDTSAAVVENGRKIVSNIVSDQNSVHKKYGGIVPELASRKHIEMIWPVVEQALDSSSITHKDISAIAFSHGPGLIGSLLVGTCFSKSLSMAWDIPMVAVNHLEGHIFSVFLESSPDFPFLALIVSGGHTSLYKVNGFRNYIELGRTRDDAAGEAYDKVAKLLGFSYPGGPIIDKLAAKGDPNSIHFPRAALRGSFDFSFSGLKTSVLNHIKKFPDSNKEHIAASFQASVVEVLANRVLEVCLSTGIKRVVLAGGVSANSAIRNKMKQLGASENLEIHLPSRHLCTDNAAMIAAAGYHYFKRGITVDYSLNPKAYMPLGSVAD